MYKMVTALYAVSYKNLYILMSSDDETIFPLRARGDIFSAGRRQFSMKKKPKQLTEKEEQNEIKKHIQVQNGCMDADPYASYGSVRHHSGIRR